MNYRKYKGFIPINAIDDLEAKNNKGEKRGLILLFLACLFLTPVTIESIFIKEEKEEHIEIEKEVVDLKGNLMKDLSFGDLALTYQGNEKKLVIDLENSKMIKELEKKEGINITTIKNKGNNKFSIEIGR